MKRAHIFILIVGFVTLATLSWRQTVVPEQSLETIDLLSTSMSKVKRTTELPKKSKIKAKKSKKEVDILGSLIKNDPAMKHKWDFNLTQVLKAWKRHGIQDTSHIKVCVIDTGIDIKHPDLKSNLDINKGEACGRPDGSYKFCEKSRNGVDDDGNGFVDDVYGFNFVTNTGNVMDNHGHGSHIAGIIAAEHGNGVGISGVAPKTKLIIAKYYDPGATGGNNLLNTVRAIRYCTGRGADIINYSGGGIHPSAIEKKAIADARDAKGRPILFIAAAGNEASSEESKKFYPGAYALPNIISVTAVDKKNKVLKTSNYGSTTVDVAAPGKNIFSTVPGGYDYLTGTSQATAIVTGAVALVKSKFPDYSASEIIRVVTESGDYKPGQLRGKTTLGKSLNIYRALSIIGDGLNAVGSKPVNTMNLNPSSFVVSPSRAAASPRGTSSLGITAEDMARVLKKGSE